MNRFAANTSNVKALIDTVDPCILADVAQVSDCTTPQFLRVLAKTTDSNIVVRDDFSSSPLLMSTWLSSETPSTCLLIPTSSRSALSSQQKLPLISDLPTKATSLADYPASFFKLSSETPPPVQSPHFKITRPIPIDDPTARCAILRHPSAACDVAIASHHAIFAIPSRAALVAYFRAALSSCSALVIDLTGGTRPYSPKLVPSSWISSTTNNASYLTTANMCSIANGDMAIQSTRDGHDTVSFGVKGIGAVEVAVEPGSTTGTMGLDLLRRRVQNVASIRVVGGAPAETAAARVRERVKTRGASGASASVLPQGRSAAADADADADAAVDTDAGVAASAGAVVCEEDGESAASGASEPDEECGAQKKGKAKGGKKGKKGAADAPKGKDDKGKDKGKADKKGKGGKALGAAITAAEGVAAAGAQDAPTLCATSGSRRAEGVWGGRIWGVVEVIECIHDALREEIRARCAAGADPRRDGSACVHGGACGTAGSDGAGGCLLGRTCVYVTDSATPAPAHIWTASGPLEQLGLQNTPGCVPTLNTAAQPMYSPHVKPPGTIGCKKAKAAVATTTTTAKGTTAVPRPSDDVAGAKVDASPSVDEAVTADGVTPDAKGAAKVKAAKGAKGARKAKAADADADAADDVKYKIPSTAVILRSSPQAKCFRNVYRASHRMRLALVVRGFGCADLDYEKLLGGADGAVAYVGDRASAAAAAVGEVGDTESEGDGLVAQRRMRLRAKAKKEKKGAACAADTADAPPGDKACELDDAAPGGADGEDGAVVTSPPRASGASAPRASGAPRISGAPPRASGGCGIAASVDLWVPYSIAVQMPTKDVMFVAGRARAALGRPALSLREDFCGTARVAVAWAQQSVSHVAYGVDLDDDAIEKGISLSQSAQVGDRVKLRIADVRAVNVTAASSPVVDVVVAMNYACMYMPARSQLVHYLASAIASSRCFIFDMLAGPSMLEPSHSPVVRRLARCPVGPTSYVFRTVAADSVASRVHCTMSFAFHADGSALWPAFQYVWRHWTPSELVDALVPAVELAAKMYRRHFATAAVPVMPRKRVDVWCNNTEGALDTSHFKWVTSFDLSADNFSATGEAGGDGATAATAASAPAAAALPPLSSLDELQRHGDALQYVSAASTAFDPFRTRPVPDDLLTAFARIGGRTLTDFNCVFIVRDRATPARGTLPDDEEVDDDDGDDDGQTDDGSEAVDSEPSDGSA